MDGTELLSRTITTIQEMYLKIGDPSGSVSLYYPYSGDFSIIEEGFRKASGDSFPRMVIEELPQRIRIIVDEDDCRKISELPIPETIRDVSKLIKDGADIEGFRTFVSRKYPEARISESEYIDFDWILLFPENLDRDVYCISEELGRLTYHRFSREEYLALGFGLP